MRNGSRRGSGIHRFLLAALLFLPASLLAEPLTLKHAVELALQHASGIGIAAADEQHSSAAYRELRNSYIPQLNAGAGIGWSDGFPLSLEGAAPSLFNVNAQSALLNPALKDFIRAAQSDVKVTALQTKDQRNQVIQDTVLSYAELEKWEQRLDRLREIFPDVQRMEAAVADRVKEGIDSEMDNSRARLSVATDAPTPRGGQRSRRRSPRASFQIDGTSRYRIHRDRCGLGASFARAQAGR